MTITIIIKDDNGKQIKSEDFNTQANENWEKTCYQIGCKVAKEIAGSMLQDIEEKIFQKRDKRLKVKGFRQRTCVTRFGDVTVSRRLYKSKEKNRFLLDEHLNWHSYQRGATPSLKEALVELSTEFSFRKVSGTMEKLLAGVLTKSTIHSLLTEVSQKAIESEKDTYTACFEQGKLTKGGELKASILYSESDGLYVHLQREKDKEGKRQEHYELKSGIIYDGWTRLPQTAERFSLTNKRVYCQSDDSIPFWDGLSLIGDKYWDMGYLKLIVLGGDDASWINKIIELPYCIRQLDGFHLARSCKRGWKNGLDMYSAIRSGRVRKTLGSLEERSGNLAIKERDHVLKCLDKGVDWRKKVDSIVIPEGSRGLGCMESNEDKLFADRMKKKGMSWTIAGAKRMGKAIQLVANGDMRAMCGRKISKCQDRFVEDRLSFDMFFYAPEYEHSVSMPVFGSPHSTRPYGRVLRDLTKND